MNETLSEYLKLSRTPWYSVVFILPLVVVYEILALIVNWESPHQLRNGADVLLRQALELFGLSAPSVMAIIFLVAVGSSWYWQMRQHNATRISSGILGLMLGESIIWAVLILVILVGASQYLIITQVDDVLRTAFLSVGAGLYEEGVFRLALIWLLLLLFRQVLRWHDIFAVGAAIIVAAALFSLFHYVGSGGDYFTWNSFAYRGVAGVLLGTLYVNRGFGITVYTHMIYDLLVLGVQTIL